MKTEGERKDKMIDKKCQYEIILDVILEVCYSMPTSFSETLARKISNTLIDEIEYLKSENNRLRNLLGKPYKRRIDLENIGLKKRIEELEQNIINRG